MPKEYAVEREVVINQPKIPFNYMYLKNQDNLASGQRLQNMKKIL
jgi:hypothetical protein